MTVALTISEKDEALIQLLKQEARLSTAELGRRLGISRTTVQSRIERLEQAGIIEGYTVQLSDSYRSGRVSASILMVIEPKALNGVIAGLRKIVEVERVQSVSGTYDLIVEVNANSVEKLDKVIDAIGVLGGVERTISLVVLSTRFQR